MSDSQGQKNLLESSKSQNVHGTIRANPAIYQIPSTVGDLHPFPSWFPDFFYWQIPIPSMIEFKIIRPNPQGKYKKHVPDKVKLSNGNKISLISPLKTHGFCTPVFFGHITAPTAPRIMVSGDNISARSALGPAVDLTGGGSDAGGSALTRWADGPWGFRGKNHGKICGKMMGYSPGFCST